MTNTTEIKNLSHKYKLKRRSKDGKFAQALDNVNLDIKQGEMIAFIGPDGVGKSTLFSIIAGVKKIQEGSVAVLGKDSSKKENRHLNSSDIAFMPQGLGSNLYRDLSIYQNLIFFAELFNIPKYEAEKKIDVLLKETGLNNFRDRRVQFLSGGMKQKLGLCCALIHDPKILILDEPTTGVDPLSRRNFWILIKDIKAKNEEITILISTAYMDEASIFERIIMMNDGQIIKDGTLESILKDTNSDLLENAYIKLLPKDKQEANIEFSSEVIDFSQSPKVIEAIGVTKKFGDFTAVNHIDFEIKEGEIFGFIGPNGCGKTTTMKMITGLIPKTEGDHKIFGEHINHDIEMRRNIGYMSQSFSLYEELTVFENLYMHAGIFDLVPIKANREIQKAVVRYGLRDYLNVKTASLPLGVKQRLSLAISVIHNPKILILDEPTSGVDPVARNIFWKSIIRLSRKRKVTIFVTTHYLSEAMRCDRIAMMNEGRLLDCDTPQAIVQKNGVNNLEDAFIKNIEKDLNDNGSRFGEAVQ